MTDDYCLYCNREGECTKGLPGTPCEVAGCVAHSRPSEYIHKTCAKKLGVSKQCGLRQELRDPGIAQVYKNDD